MGNRDAVEKVNGKQRYSRKGKKGKELWIQGVKKLWITMGRKLWIQKGKEL